MVGLAAAVIGVLVSAAPAALGASAVSAPGLTGARGLDIAPGGRVLVSQANGSYGFLVRQGENKGKFRKLGAVQESFVAPAMDMNDHGTLFVLTSGGKGPGYYSLYRWTRRDGQEKVARLRAYQREDKDPYDLEDKPGESNPYGMQRHLYDKTQPENLPFLERIRTLLNEYGAASVGEIGDESAARAACPLVDLFAVDAEIHGIDVDGEAVGVQRLLDASHVVASHEWPREQQRGRRTRRCGWSRGTRRHPSTGDW